MKRYELGLGSFALEGQDGHKLSKLAKLCKRGTWNPVWISRCNIDRSIEVLHVENHFRLIIAGPKVSKSILKRQQNCWKGSKIVAFILGASLTMFLASTPGRPFVNIDGSTKPGWNIWNHPQNNYFLKKFKQCLLPPFDIITQTQKNICQQLLSYSLFSVITISKRLEENKFAKEIKTLSEEVAAANFAPLVCFPA